jgi:hypothetical protein
VCHLGRMRPDVRWQLLAGVLLAACGPARGGDDAETAATDSSGSTGSTGPTGSTEAPWEESPDCEGLQLPGDPVDLASTPRPDRDAEMLALSVEPSLAVATQAHYEVVRADLATIREVDPPLADVHVARYFDALELWFLGGSQSALDAIWAREYHAWDCLNERYGGSYPQPIDGFGFLLRFDGVYGEVVRDAYAALPGLEDADIDRSSTCILGGCEFAGSIELTPTVDAEGALVTREYRFESKDEVVRVYRVVEGEAPMLVE